MILLKLDVLKNYMQECKCYMGRFAPSTMGASRPAACVQLSATFSCKGQNWTYVELLQNYDCFYRVSAPVNYGYGPIDLIQIIDIIYWDLR